MKRANIKVPALFLSFFAQSKHPVCNTDLSVLCRVLILQGVAEFKLSNKSNKLIDINGIIFVNNCFKQEEIVCDLGAFTVLLGVCVQVHGLLIHKLGPRLP